MKENRTRQEDIENVIKSNTSVGIHVYILCESQLKGMVEVPIMDIFKKFLSIENI